MKNNIFKNCIISTVDHPYVSPPVRLLDSHRLLYNLSKRQKVIVLNWDVSLPNDRTYKYDCQIDIPIVGRRVKLFIFSDNKTPYALQSVKKPNLDAHAKELDEAILFYKKNKILSEESIKNIYENYDELSKKIFSKISDNHYTKYSIIEMYKILGHNDLADFISRSYYYFFNSKIMTDTIPDLIESVEGEKSIYNLMKNNVLARRAFRSTTNFRDDDINDPEYFKNNKLMVTQKIRSGKIIPSIEILFWAIETLGAYHFGNDLGFFDRYGKYLGIILKNQLTQETNDGIQYFKLEKDFGLTRSDNTLSFKKKLNESKHSRINSMFGIYIAIGAEMKNHKHRKTKSINIVNGGFKVS